MTSQADKDWEEFQLGQQGTFTGSGHNQMGYDSRPNQGNNARTDYSAKQKSKREPVKAKRTKAKGITTDKDDFNVWFAAIAFIVSGLYFYNPADENGVATLIGAGIIGLLSGKLYKFIIGIAMFLAIILFFAAIGESPK